MIIDDLFFFVFGISIESAQTNSDLAVLTCIKKALSVWISGWNHLPLHSRF